MKAWAKEVREKTQLRWNRVNRFQAKINLYIEFGSYIIKTADTQEELVESFRLRHMVFFQELQENNRQGLDIDRFDSIFDHLIILHKGSNKIIGTYRLSCSDFSKASYTELEFELAEIYKLKGPHLELGRACIQKEHRRGAVIALLWRGIAEYMNVAGANILFGCSSLKICSAREAALVYRYMLDQGSVMEANLSKPQKKFKMQNFDLWLCYFQNGLEDFQKEEAESIIPSLLKSYLNVGAKIAAEPAFDRNFNCIDMLTVLKKDDLANSLVRRFQVVR